MSRRLRRDISYYKYLNSGAIPRQSKSAEEILDVTQRIEGNLTERENDSEEVLSGVSESSNQHSAQVVSLDTNEVSEGSSISSIGNLRFLSVPPYQGFLCQVVGQLKTLMQNSISCPEILMGYR